MQYASGEISSTIVWDLDKEQLLSCIPLASDCSISALVGSPKMHEKKKERKKQFFSMSIDKGQYAYIMRQFF